MQAGENDYGGSTDAAITMVKNPPDLKEGCASVYCMQPGYLSTVRTEF